MAIGWSENLSTGKIEIGPPQLALFYSSFLWNGTLRYSSLGLISLAEWNQ